MSGQFNVPADLILEEKPLVMLYRLRSRSGRGGEEKNYPCQESNSCHYANNPIIEMVTLSQLY
jgi:hypothetical protein